MVWMCLVQSVVDFCWGNTIQNEIQLICRLLRHGCSRKLCRGFSLTFKGLRLWLLSVANTKPRLLPSSMIMLDLIFLYCFFSDSKTLRSFSRVFLAVPAAGGKAWVKSSVFSSGNNLLFFNSSKAECGLWTKRSEKARIWNWRFSVKQRFCMFGD